MVHHQISVTEALGLTPRGSTGGLSSPRSYFEVLGKNCVLSPPTFQYKLTCVINCIKDTMFVLYKRYCLFDCFRPGFGVTLNREGLERPYTRTAEQVSSCCLVYFLLSPQSMSLLKVKKNFDANCRCLPSTPKMPF